MTFSRSLSNKLEGVDEAAGRAASLPILLCHGRGMNLRNNSFSREQTAIKDLGVILCFLFIS